MNATQYMKNVGKSLGYIAIDSFKQMNPAIAAVYDNAKEFTQDLYQTIDDFKGKAVGSNGDSLTSKAKSIANDTWKNARDDFLSGKWYNTERKAAASDEMMKAMGFDFDFDLDFDLDDAFEEGSSNSTNVEEMEQSAKETAAVMGTIEGSVASAANSMVSATVQSTEYLASIQNVNSSALYNLNSKGFNNVNLGLNAINANLSTALSLAEPLTAHMQNSATFYAKSTEFQNKTISLLEQLIKNTSPAQPKKSSKGPQFEDYVGSNGIDFARLFSDAKENVSKEIKGYKEMLDMFGGGKGLTSDITSSPISAFLTSILIPSLVPKGTKKRMKGLNEYIETLGFNALNKYGKKFNESALGFIADFLGFKIPTINNKTKISTSGYEKGKVDWNGKAQKALMEVIPYYLAKMTAIMDGGSEMEIFDYEKGKFTTRKKIQEEFDKQQRGVARSYSYDFYGKIEKASPGVKDKISKEDLDELTRLLMLQGGQEYYLLFSPNRKDRDEWLKSHPVINDYLNSKPYLKQYIHKTAQNSGKGKGATKYDLGTYSMNIGQAQASYTNKLKSAEQSGEFDLLFNESSESKIKGAGLFGGTDKNGYSALDYLRGIFINTSGGNTGGNKPTSAAFIPEDLPGRVVKNNDSNLKIENGQGSTANANRSRKISDQEILKQLSDRYGKEWDDLASDRKIKDYLMEKQRAESEYRSDEFTEDDAIETQIRIKRFTSGLSNFGKELGISQHVGNFLEKMGNIIQSPVDIVNRTIDAIKSSIHDIVFSKNGLIGWLFDKENGKLTPTLNKIKESFASVLFGRKVEEEGIDLNQVDTSEIGESIRPGTAQFDALWEGNNYNGKIVRKTGIAAVSEGELIIPAEFNPYYSKPIDKAKQIASENRAISRFFGSFDEGGTVGQEQKKTRREGGLVGVASNVLQKGFVDFGQLLYQTFSRSVGIGDEKKEEEDKKKIQGILKGAFSNIKEHGAEAAVGAIIGGGVSLLTGAAISPILGASLGAATGLLMTSNKMQDFLFGTEDGKTDGLIKGETGRKIRNFLNEQLPTSLVGGGLGAVGGALLGHPVLGLFLGSGIGFATKSIEVQDFLFGKKDENGERQGGFISKELQKKFKAAMPGASAGAIAGLVATAFGGPFGIVGNMMLGAGIGTVVNSEKFKNWFLGEKGEDGKRQGGFVQELRNRVLDPAREMILNIGDRIRQDFRDVSLNFSKALTNFVKKLGTPLRAIGRTAKKGINWVGTELLGLPNLPDNMLKMVDLRKIANRVRGGNLRRGFTTFKNGKALTAADRLAEMSELGIDQDSFGYTMASILQGKGNNELNALTTELNDLFGLSADERAAKIAGSETLSKLKGTRKAGTLSDTEIRRMQDAIKIERGKNPITLVADTTIDIAKGVGKIVTEGVMIKNLNPTRDTGHDTETTTTESTDATNPDTTTHRISNNFWEQMQSSGNQTQGEDAASTNAGQSARQAQQRIEEEAQQRQESLDRVTNATENLQRTTEAITGSDAVSSNDKESKKSGLFGKFFGKESVIGKAAGIITKFGSLAGLALIALAPILNKLAAKLFPDLFGGDDNGMNVQAADKDGNVVEDTGFSLTDGFTTTDANGNIVPMEFDDINVKIKDKQTFGQRVWGTAARGSGLLASVLAPRIAMNIKNGIELLSKIPGLNKISSRALADLTQEATSEAAKKAASEAVDGVAAKAIKGGLQAQIYISLAFAVVDFTTGMQDAESILKVSHPTMPQRLIAGAVKAIKNITIIGALFPESWIVDLVMKHFAADLGLEEFEAQRKAAEEELAAYNEEHGTDLNWDQYQKGVLDNKTWTERGFEALGTGAARTWQAITNPKKYIEEIYSKTLQGFNETEGSLYNKLLGAEAGFTDAALPGIMGNISATITRVWTAAGEGDIQKLWAENIDQFKDDDSIISQVASNVLIPGLLSAKIVATPMALINKLTYNIRDGFKEVDFGDNPFANLAENAINLAGHAFAGDMAELWSYDASLGSQYEGFNTLYDVAMTTSKIAYTPITAVTWVIKKVWNAVEPFGKPLADITVHLVKDDLAIKGYSLIGDIKEMWEYSPDLGTDNKFLETLHDISATITKVIHTPLAALTWVVKNAAKALGTIINLEDINSLIEDDLVIRGYSLTGQMKELWEYDSKLETESKFIGTLHDISNVIKKVTYTPFTAITWTLRKVFEGLGKVKDTAIEVFPEWLTDNLSLSAYAFAGDIEGMWNYEPNLNTDNKFIETLHDIVSTVKKVTYTPYAAISWVGHKVGETFATVVENAKIGFDYMNEQGEKGSEIIHDEDSEFTELFELPEIDEDVPFKGLFKAATIGARVLGVAVEVVKGAARVITDMFTKEIGPELLNLGTGMALDSAKIGLKVAQGDVAGLWQIKESAAASTVKTGLAKGIANVRFNILRVTETIPAAITTVVKFAVDGLVDLGKKVINVGSVLTEDDLSLSKLAYTGDIAGMWNLKSSADSESETYVKVISKAGLLINKIVKTPIAAVTTTVKLLAEGIAENISTGIQTFDEIKTDTDSLAQIATNHNPSDVLGYESTAINASGEHPFWGAIGEFVLAFPRIFFTGVSAVGLVMDKVSEGISKLKEAASATFGKLPDDFTNLKNIADTHKPGDVWNYVSGVATAYNESGGEYPFFSVIAESVLTMVRIPMVGVAAVGAVGDFIEEKFKSIKETFSSAIKTFKDNIDKGESIFAAGDDASTTISNLFSDLPSDDNSIGGGLFNGITVLTRIAGAGVLGFKMAGNMVKGIFKGVTDAFSENTTIYDQTLQSIKDVYNNDDMTYQNVWDIQLPYLNPGDPLALFEAAAFGITRITFTISKFITGFFKSIKDEFNFNNIWNDIKDLANFKASRGGSGSGIGAGSSGFVSQIDPKYSGQNLGGYSVGDIGCGPAAASMVLGNSMNSNIKLAKKYQTTGGTDLAYFADAFARNGRSATYYNLSAGASGTDMVRDIASGKPVVLMGRDPYNTSKRNSPFGPKNHYVVARGFKNGGVVIDDPESKVGGQIYDTNILGSVTAAVSAGASGLRRLTGIGGGGASISAISGQIWAFFKAKGYSDAAVAGILANIQAESSFRTGADNPTDAAGGSHGLCQWNGSRWTALKNRAKAMGRSEYDLTVQLEHIHGEIGQAGAGYTSLSDPAAAAEQFCRKFERPLHPDKDCAIRRPLAVEFYNHYTGSNITYQDNPIVDGGDTNDIISGITDTKPKSKVQQLLGLTSGIGGLFSKALGNKLSGFSIANLFSKGFGSSSDDVTDAENQIIDAIDGGDGTIGGDLSITSWPGKQPVEYMRDVLGKLTYSTTNRDPEKGGGDCSSTVAWALTKAGLPVTSDSRWQYVNQDGTTPSWQNVLWYNGGTPLGKGKPIPVPLQPNDVIFYSHGGSSYPDHVDHVEMYNGNNEIIGNGGGKGTRTRPASSMQDQIIKIVRPKLGGSGSGLLSDIEIDKASGNMSPAKVYDFNKYRQKGAVANRNKNEGGIDKETALILKSLIALIESIVKNTNDISGIYELLSVYCSKNPHDKSAEVLSKIAENRKNDSSNVEETLADLKATVNSILAS